jgi:hypothetical protein
MAGEWQAWCGAGKVLVLVEFIRANDAQTSRVSEALEVFWGF